MPLWRVLVSELHLSGVAQKSLGDNKEQPMPKQPSKNIAEVEESAPALIPSQELNLNELIQKDKL